MIKALITDDKVHYIDILSIQSWDYCKGLISFLN